MTRSITKIKALFNLKLRLILLNMSLMIAPIMAILYTLFMKMLFENKFPSHAVLTTFVLTLGLLFNIVMGGIMMTSYPLAEEKEKHTLRVLITSSITGPEFFIGSLLPPLLIITATNLLLVPLSGASWSQIHLGSYLLLTIITSLTSLVIGYIIGLLTTTQSQAGVASVPLMLILILLPSMQQFSPTLQKITNFLYTGTIDRFVTDSLSPRGFTWTASDIAVQLISLIIGCVIFFYAYRRHGLSND